LTTGVLGNFIPVFITGLHRYGFIVFWLVRVAAPPLFGLVTLAGTILLLWRLLHPAGKRSLAMFVAVLAGLLAVAHSSTILADYVQGERWNVTPENWLGPPCPPPVPYSKR
jgi:hypothetical protein